MLKLPLLFFDEFLRLIAEDEEIFISLYTHKNNTRYVIIDWWIKERKREKSAGRIIPIITSKFFYFIYAVLHDKIRKYELVREK